MCKQIVCKRNDILCAEERVHAHMRQQRKWEYKIHNGHDDDEDDHVYKKNRYLASRGGGGMSAKKHDGKQYSLAFMLGIVFSCRHSIVFRLLFIAASN